MRPAGGGAASAVASLPAPPTATVPLRCHNPECGALLDIGPLPLDFESAVANLSALGGAVLAAQAACDAAA